MAFATLLAGVGAMALILWGGPVAAGEIVPQRWPGAAQDTAFTLVLYGAMIVVAVLGGRIAGCRPMELGSRPASRFAKGSVLGAAGLALASAFAAIAGALAPGTGKPSALIVVGLVVVLVQAAAEEIYFRGWIQSVLMRSWGALPAIAVTAGSFAALHMLTAAAAPLSFFNLLLGGVVFGVLAVQGGGLASAIGAHFAWNGSEQLALGLDPNPGSGSFGSLFDLDLVGPAMWGGSAEGLNASLAMAMALIVVLVPTAMLARGAVSQR